MPVGTAGHRHEERPRTRRSATSATIGSVEKLSATIQESATKIDSECTVLNSAVRRLLDEALVALAGAHATGPELVNAA